MASLTDRERLEQIQVSTIPAEQCVVLHREDFRWLCERAMARASSRPADEDLPASDEAAAAEPAPEEPGEVARCCSQNIEHEVFRLLPTAGMENVVGEGTLSVKSPATGVWLPVYCCAFCARKS